MRNIIATSALMLFSTSYNAVAQGQTETLALLCAPISQQSSVGRLGPLLVTIDKSSNKAVTKWLPEGEDRADWNLIINEETYLIGRAGFELLGGRVSDNSALQKAAMSIHRNTGVAVYELEEWGTRRRLATASMRCSQTTLKPRF